ncbi:MAG: preprotein translocase subunit YajC [Kiritimatiellae bacterium]|nr:preprotein translocase subunit YajC [Kiritimatiellia bacterium]
MNNCIMLCAADAAAPAPAAPAGAPQQSGMGMLVPMLLILGIYYFMMIRPQQRKEKERRRMIDELRAGAKVVFAGGIVGTIVEATEKTFRVETAPGTEMEILHSCVQGVVPAEGPAAVAEAK